ncbi:MAG: NAD-dependent epimerase/dehydratase family protein [Lachnospiraceae bacterium]|nr:NAD-dependent epimerase/dehydratase family protein [Lachnospiraceae bacterium]
MKKILITGAKSFIGTSVELYLNKWPDKYKVDTLDMRKKSWRTYDFKGYDTVFHVAGIAHSDTRKISSDEKARYKKVNTDLVIETAKKAQKDGVGQFIFMSSSIVYGETPRIGKKKVIAGYTIPEPDNYYGESKLKAEEGLKRIEKEDETGSFKIAVLRPPMIYGKNCKGNYPLLSKLAGKLAFFPDAGNKRSVLYVENLAELIRLIIDNNDAGLFFPQNSEYATTSDLVKNIRLSHGKKTHLIKGFTWALKFLGLFSRKVNKAFGTCYYEQDMSTYRQEYRLVDLRESIRRTEL